MARPLAICRFVLNWSRRTLTVQIKLPPKLLQVFASPRGAVRYRGAYGGRGSGKSFNFAKMAAVMGYAEPLRILCTRELQTSIKESFHAELKAAIASEWWLENHYDVGVDYLRGANGTEFIFRGLRHNIGSIKSLARIDICIVEEAEDVPEASWIDLEPTIRADNSEIWVVWNPRKESSPVDKRFIKSVPPRAEIEEVNWSDNPWFPGVLEEQRKHALATMDYAQYAHIWEGKYWAASDAQVFRDKFRIDDTIKPGNEEVFYYGADWGFANDPTTLLRLWINEAERQIFIDQEAYEVRVEIDELPDFFRRVDGSELWKITADSARPETISYMNNQGFHVVAAKKGKGSVDEGVNFLKSYEIIVHPRCTHTIEELRLYSYKRDRITNEVLPILQDANNHCLIAGTLVATDKGYIKIEDVNVGDGVLTRKGFCKVVFSGVTGEKLPLLNVISNNSSLVCTCNHVVFTLNNGFIRADALRYGDELIFFRGTGLCLILFNIAGKLIGVTRKVKDVLTGFILKLLLQVGKFGCIEKLELWRSIILFQLKKYVSNVVRILKQNNLGILIGFAVINVKASGGVTAVETMLKEHALSATQFFSQTNIIRLFAVVDHVQIVNERGISDKVYDLTIDVEHEFFADGILVHNCIDAARYGLEQVMNAIFIEFEEIPVESEGGW